MARPRPPRPPIDPVNKPPVEPPAPHDPLLTRVSVTFHTNDEDKDHDTAVRVRVKLRELTIAHINDEFGHFDDHTDAGPYTLLMVRPLGREQLKRATVELAADAVAVDPPFGHGDTWRFSFVVDLFFEDGTHLLSRASGLEADFPAYLQEFGVE